MSEIFQTITICSLLIVGFATVLNLILLKKYPLNETFKKTIVIVKSWWFIIGFVLLCLGTAPDGMLIGFGCLSLFGVFEYLKHSRLEGLKKPVAIMVSLAIILQYLLLWKQHLDVFFFVPLIFLLYGMSLIIILYGKIERLAETFASFAVLIFVFHCVAYLPALFFFQSKATGYDDGIILIFLIILLTEANDIFQFLCGKKFGKRKIVPLISPNKTEMGFFGGLILTTILSSFLFQKFLNFNVTQSVLLGIIISITGMFGDLTFSAMKRFLGTKDFSDTLPGHGGILDRLDSLIYTTPAVFYFMYFYVGFN